MSGGPPGDAGQVRQPAEGVGNAGEAGAVPIGAVLAVAGDAHQHQAGVDCLELLWPEPPFLQRAWSKILAQDVGLGDEPLEERRPLWLAQVEGDRLLVALLREPGIAVAALARRAELAQRVAEAGLLDLDDLGAELAEDGGGERPGDEGREVDDSDAVERQRCGHGARKRRLGPHVNRPHPGRAPRGA